LKFEESAQSDSLYSTLLYKTINASMKNVEAFWRMVHGGFRRANWTLK